MTLKSCPCWIVWTARAIAAASLLVGYTTSASADDAQAHGAVTSPAAPSSTTNRAAPSAAASTATTNTSAPKVICLQNSIRCFSMKSTVPGASASPALDLRAPDIHRVFTAAELQQTLQDPDEETVYQETVQVEGQRQTTPVSVGIMALPWAIIHPTQAWRILMPLPDAK